jgi:glycosyltransferase involved in cell wall biosynthesis
MTVSVIIPSFNREKLLSNAIDSALRQTLPASEVIVVDDGSEDNTQAVVRKYGSQVVYIRQENKGVGSARNLGISVAKGKYISFLDSDDMWLDFKLAMQVAILEKLPEIGFLFTEFFVLKDDSRKIPKGSQHWLEHAADWTTMYDKVYGGSELYPEFKNGREDFMVYTGNIYRRLLESAYILTSTAVVRRDAIGDSIRFTEGVTIYEDWEFYARLSRFNDCAFVDIETAINRGHSGPRLTRSSQLVKTQRYLSMIDRVWGQDFEFKYHHLEDLRIAEGRALLAVGRSALLAAQPTITLKAIERWRSLRITAETYRARLYFILALFPGGGLILRLVSKIRTAIRILTCRTRHGHYPVNPAI